MKIRHLVILLIFTLAGSTVFAETAEGPRVPLTTDLQADVAQARALGVPLLLMFSLDDCPYCMVVREEFLDPMQLSGDYRDRVLMRILDMDGDFVTDFDGQRVSADDLAVRYGASVAPTVVLLDHHGQLLVKRLLGITTPDYYGVYLDAAIKQSLLRLREQLVLVQQ